MKYNDDELVKELINKNQEALNQLINIYERLIYSVVKNVLNQDFEAEELQECLSDIYFAIWNKIESYDQSKGTLKNWILALSKHKSIDYKRKLMIDKKYKVALDEEVLHLSDQSADQEMKMIESESFNEIVLKIMNQLNEKEQILFRHLFIEEIAQEKIIMLMGISCENLYNKVSRLKKKLRLITAS